MAVIAFFDRKYKYHGTVSSHAQEHEVETTGECYKPIYTVISVLAATTVDGTESIEVNDARWTWARAARPTVSLDCERTVVACDLFVYRVQTNDIKKEIKYAVSYWHMSNLYAVSMRR